MTGLELVVGYLAVWAARKAGRVVRRADAEVDRVLDAPLDKLHDLVSSVLVEDPALVQLEREAAAGQEELKPRTQQRVQLALEEAGEQDPELAAALRAAVAAIQDAEKQAGLTHGGAMTAFGFSQVNIATHGGIAGVIQGSTVTTNPPPLPGPSKP